MPTDNRAIALIAHDAKKETMVAFVAKHKTFLRTRQLVATATTGTLIQTHAGFRGDIAQRVG
jgi:methylglyoxal synthase